MATNCISHMAKGKRKKKKCKFVLFFRNCACAEIMKQCERTIISRRQSACNQHPASQNTSILHIDRHTSKLTSSSAGVPDRVKALNLAQGCGFQSQLREKYPSPTNPFSLSMVSLVTIPPHEIIYIYIYIYLYLSI